MRGCTELFEHVQGIPDTVGGEVKEFGEFHNPDRLVISHCPRYFHVPAYQFDLVLHLLEHNNPAHRPYRISRIFLLSGCS